jgi:uncharacterized protein (TIGR02145 family)
MTIIKALAIGFIAVSLCIAQITVTIGGKVTDSTGVTPIAGATVQLEKGGLSTTSGADGSFLLFGATGTINSQSNKPLSGKITASLHNGYLSLNIREKSDIEIALYTIRGKKLSTLHQTLAEGYHSVALPTTVTGVCFYRIRVGNEEFVLKGNSLTGASGGVTISNQSTTTPTILTSRRAAYSYVPIDDVILVTKSGYLNYGEQVKNSDTTGIVIKMHPSAGTVLDFDENVYQTVKIGNQVWMAENLRTTRYNDGSTIPLVTDNAAWFMDTAPAYCYSNNTTNANAIIKFGALYNWYTVNPANPQKIAMPGWHVPSDVEWTILEKYLVLNGYNWDGTTTGNKIAKSLAVKMDWYPFTTTTGTIVCDLTKNNRSGFSALPGGYRDGNSTFISIGYTGFWWSVTEFDASSAYNRSLYSSGDTLFRLNYFKSFGFSVRLFRDN